MRVLIADGGTGGHIFPAIAVADELRMRKEVDAILFTGTPLGLEKELVPGHNYELRMIRVGGLIGKSMWIRMKTLLQLPFAYMQSRRIVKEFHPDVTVGFGAYASGPVLMAAHHCHVPVVLMEPNAVPGFTNRVALRFATRIAVPFEDQEGVFRGKAVVTGNPVRALKSAPARGEKFTLGIFGGSQGARGINRTIAEALPQLAELHDRLHVVHQTGKGDFEELKKRYDEVAPFYEVTPFIYDVEQFYNRCDLLICRAGAITLAEVTSLGKPAILVPLPTATHGHQEQNARRLMNAGAARMIVQAEFTVDRLMTELGNVMDNEAELRRMAEASLALGKPDAAKRVADLVMSVAMESGRRSGSGQEARGIGAQSC